MCVIAKSFPSFVIVEFSYVYNDSLETKYWSELYLCICVIKFEVTLAYDFVCG